MIENWKKTILKPQSSIYEAIENLNDHGYCIILVSNNNHELIGTVTDGDIRRALIKHSPLDTPIKNIMNTNPQFLFHAHTILMYELL